MDIIGVYTGKWIGYLLMTSEGEVITGGITPFESMGKIVAPRDGCYISILLAHSERGWAAGAVDTWARKNNRQDITDKMVASMQAGRRRQVQCNETGEVWDSAIIAADAHNLTYNQLLQHLKRTRGFKTVKGRTYTYL